MRLLVLSLGKRGALGLQRLLVDITRNTGHTGAAVFLPNTQGARRCESAPTFANLRGTCYERCVPYVPGSVGATNALWREPNDKFCH